MVRQPETKSQGNYGREELEKLLRDYFPYGSPRWEDAIGAILRAYLSDRPIELQYSLGVCFNLEPVLQALKIEFSSRVMGATAFARDFEKHLQDARAVPIRVPKVFETKWETEPLLSLVLSSILPDLVSKKEMEKLKFEGVLFLLLHLIARQGTHTVADVLTHAVKDRVGGRAVLPQWLLSQGTLRSIPHELQTTNNVARMYVGIAYNRELKEEIPPADHFFNNAIKGIQASTGEDYPWVRRSVFFDAEDLPLVLTNLELLPKIGRSQSDEKMRHCLELRMAGASEDRIRKELDFRKHHTYERWLSLRHLGLKLTEHDERLPVIATISNRQRSRDQLFESSPLLATEPLEVLVDSEGVLQNRRERLLAKEERHVGDVTFDQTESKSRLEHGFAGPHSPVSKSLEKRNVILFSVEADSFVLNGKPYKLNTPAQFMFFAKLREAEGQPVTWRSIREEIIIDAQKRKEKVTENSYKRPRDVFKGNMQPLMDAAETVKGASRGMFKLKFPFVQQKRSIEKGLGR